MNFKDRIAFFNTNQKKEDNKQVPKKLPQNNEKESNINGKNKINEKVENKRSTENNETKQKDKLANGNIIINTVKLQTNSNTAKTLINGNIIKPTTDSNTIYSFANIINITNNQELGKKKEEKIEKENNIINLPKKENIKEKKLQNGPENNIQQIKGFNPIKNIEQSSTSKIGKLMDGKHPIYGSGKVGEITSRKDESKKLIVYNYPLNIEYSSNEESISILFVGQSGAGKSTFINAYVNHILGITCNDNIRYKLIFGDAKKERDQTQSQTDFITTYNVRSLKYKNKLFKLIDTPGAGDTRNENEKQLSKTEKDKKEKEFLAMYNKLFSEEIGQLNSIVFVVKASENRENEFQKKIVKNITDLFADDIGQNCLAILTFTDNDEVVPDAVQLMEKMDIFRKKTKKNEEWYFPVSSTSYFIPFKLGNPTEAFNFTEKAFENFTNKLLSLKVYLTKETQKNLELKNRQEKIIKILKENILENLLNKLIGLKNTEINLKQKIEECNKQQEEIEKIKTQVSQEVNLKNEIQRNYELHSNLRNQKLQDLENNKKAIESLKTKNSDLENKINILITQQQNAEKEKKEAKINKCNFKMILKQYKIKLIVQKML